MMKEIIERMQNRIMQHQKENGFETIFDFLNEDLDEMKQSVIKSVCGKKNCNEPVYEFGRCFKHYCQSENSIN